MGREYLLRDALREWESVHRAEHGRAPADYVLFDCPPSLGLLSINALAASGEVLITLQTEFLALQGMSKLVEVTQLLKRRLNPDLEVSAILPCLYDSRLKLAREVLGEIRRYFPGLVLERPIRSSVKLAEAPSFAQTIFEYADDSHAADDYRAAAQAVIARESRDADLAGLPEFDATKRLARPPSARVPPPRARKRPRPPRRCATARDQRERDTRRSESRITTRSTGVATDARASDARLRDDELAVRRVERAQRHEPGAAAGSKRAATLERASPSGHRGDERDERNDPPRSNVSKASQPARHASQPTPERATPVTRTKVAHPGAVERCARASRQGIAACADRAATAGRADDVRDRARQRAVESVHARSSRHRSSARRMVLLCVRRHARRPRRIARSLSPATKARNGVDASLEREPARSALTDSRGKVAPSVAADSAGAAAARSAAARAATRNSAGSPVEGAPARRKAPRASPCVARATRVRLRSRVRAPPTTFRSTICRRTRSRS
jgi:hypothetical protein